MMASSTTSPPFDPQFLWGTLPPAPNAPPPSSLGLSPADKDALCRLPAKPLTLEGPKLYQPKCQAPTTVPSALPPNAITAHGVRLQRYLASGSGLAMPEVPLPVSLAQKNPFPQGDRFAKLSQPPSKSEIAALPAAAAMRGLHGATAELTAFVGFHKSSSSALDILTDVTADFLRRLSLKLSEEREIMLETGSTGGFPDILERTLRDFGIDSVSSLRHYYENDVVEPYRRLHEEATAGHAAAAEHQVASAASASSAAAPIFLMSSGEDIPEIHFPSSEEGEVNLDHATPQLETGLQMLQSLEQQQQDFGMGGSDSAASSPQVKKRRL